MLVKLIPKTSKGKNRVKRWGDIWMILDDMRNRLFISSIQDIDEKKFLPDSARWVDKKGDIDFIIEFIKSEQEKQTQEKMDRLLDRRNPKKNKIT